MLAKLFSKYVFGLYVLDFIKNYYIAESHSICHSCNSLYISAEPHEFLVKSSLGFCCVHWVYLVVAVMLQINTLC